MAAVTNVAHRDLLQIAATLATEKGIENETVIEALEQAIQQAARKKYGSEQDIRAVLDRESGAVSLALHREVVGADTEFLQGQHIALEEAQRRNPDAEIGDVIIDDMPPIEFGRITAQAAKQMIVQKVREAERERQYNEYKDRVGEIINGIVKREERFNKVVDLGRAEAMLRRDDCLPREPLRRGDRVRAYIYDVRREARGPQIFISRVHPDFMKKLFEMEVPEIYDGIIEIRAVARDAGSRAKIAVRTNDDSIDPVGACVGMRGSRVQAVVNELGGEKVDIIPWSADTATFVVNALQPAKVLKVVMDEDVRRMEVVVPDDEQSLAIGRRGQNVRLASQLVNWDIDIMTETDESERRATETRQQSQHFMDALDVDDVLARLLVAEGFTDAEEVAFVPIDEILSIEGLDEGIAQELQSRALQFVEERDMKFDARRRELGVDDEVAGIEGLTPGFLVRLGEADITSLNDLAELSKFELVEDYLPGTYLDLDDAEAIIMAARAHWFAGDDADAAAHQPAQGDESDDRPAQ